MTDKTYNRTVFSGLDRHGATSLPRWYRSLTRSNGVDVPNFRDALLDLERATKVPLAYLDPEDIGSEGLDGRLATDEVIDRARQARTVGEFLESIGVITSGKYRALVNPNWLGKANREASDKGDALWQPPTNQYVPVNPVDAYGPLIGVARQRDAADVYGEIREYHYGGEVHMDLFFDKVRTKIPNGPEFIWGVTTGYDFRGYHSHYAHLIAANPDTGTVYRRLYPNAGKRKHVGPRSGQETATEDVAAWWVDVFDHLEAATDALTNTVAEAMEYRVDENDLLDDWTVAFTANGLGPYADAAADRLPKHKTVTAYDLFVAGAAALDAEFDGKDDGSAAKDYTNAANRFLFRPAVAEQKALKEQQQILDDRDNLTPEDRLRRKDLISAAATLGEATTQARSFRKRLRDLLDAAEEGDEPNADAEEVAA